MRRSNFEIEEILNSLDGIARAEARPFMHTRVMARVEEENAFWTRAVRLIARPAIAFACIAAILIANLYTILNVETEETDVAALASGPVVDVLHNDNYILAVNDN